MPTITEQINDVMNKTLLATSNDVQSALIKVSDLFDSGHENILVCNTGASKSQFDRLNKQLREVFYCRRTEGGFIVNSTAAQHTLLASPPSSDNSSSLTSSSDDSSDSLSSSLPDNELKRRRENKNSKRATNK